MALAVKHILLGSNSKQITSQRKTEDSKTRFPYPRTACCSLLNRNDSRVICTRTICKFSAGVSVASLGAKNEDVKVSSAADFTNSANTFEAGEMKIRIDITGAKTQAIYDNVFSKLVAAAQPIPGFRRGKGGKTPDVSKHVLLHIIGSLKVKKQAIQRIINTSVAEYAEKEGLKITEDLRVAQSFEELEATFEPGKEFSFDAIIQLKETDTKISR
ncbi:hypothetical protein MRB53_035221 [Persea americana]|uniref:Uncharacterized protein n=1 Tax=Persea americana TaxID=3435 RepID=A0ACC2K3Y5_PERAE|nr:hypothetical protein MRB53_035221 [Persea americana]|eukprot:TRINITY_DN7530_c0_g1_i1.p1 TRINITY_DN7530_c0_g1~~TRINITY_DN7530_c0_g1_i1.p1  ORF type:complete len:215 (-),score=48.52 TRINITY_DN7530_c0_g1_i1:387-1031(-)